MKKNKVVMLFLSVNFMLVFLHLYKQSLLLKFSYKKQKQEKIINDLLEEKKSFEQRLNKLRSHAKIKEFAITNLGMEKARLNQIHYLPSTVL